jgi:hypothetical protein
MAVVYQHRRKDTNEIFYIGIGKNKIRAYENKSRNQHWHSIAKKCGYDVDVLFEGINLLDACEIEKGLIKSIGRKDLELGPLVNMTDGGEGIHGMLFTSESKKKMSEIKKGRKFSDEHKKKLSESHKGHKLLDSTKEKLSIIFKDREFSLETRQKLAEKRKDKKPFLGRKHSEETILKMKESYQARKV